MNTLRALPLTLVTSLSLSPMAGAVSLVVNPFQTVTLSPGTYRYDKVIVHAGGSLEFTGDTTLIISGNLEVREEWVTSTGIVSSSPPPCYIQMTCEASVMQGTLDASGTGGKYGKSGNPYGPTGEFDGPRGRFAYWDDAGNIWLASAGGNGEKGPDGGAGTDGKGGYRININASGDIRIDGVVRATGGPSGGWGGNGTTGGFGGGGGYNGTWTIPPWLATEQNPVVLEDALRKLGQGAPGGNGGKGGAGGAGGDGGDGATLAFNAGGDVVLGPSGTIYTSGAVGGRGGRGGNGGSGGSGGYSVESLVSYGPNDVRRLRLNGADAGDGADGGTGGAGGIGGDGGSLYLQGRRVELLGSIYQQGGRGGTAGDGGWGGDGRNGGNSACCLPESSSSLSIGSGSGGAGGDGGDGGDGGNGGAGGDGGNLYVRSFVFVNTATIQQQGGDGGMGGAGGNAGAGGQGGYGLNLSQDPLHGPTYSGPGGGDATPVQSRNGIPGNPGADGKPGFRGTDGTLHELTSGLPGPIGLTLPDVLLNFRQSGNPNGQAEVVRVGGENRIVVTVDSLAEVTPFSLAQLVKLGNIPRHFEFGYRWLDASPNGYLELTLNEIALLRIDHDGIPEGTVTSPLGLDYFLEADANHPGFSLLRFDVPSLADLPAEIATTLAGSDIASFEIRLYPGSPVGIQFSEITTPSVATVVPVPAALWLFGCGLLGLMLVGRRSA